MEQETFQKGEMIACTNGDKQEWNNKNINYLNIKSDFVLYF